MRTRKGRSIKKSLMPFARLRRVIVRPQTAKAGEETTERETGKDRVLLLFYY
jgi:hypothetical protein